METYKALIRYEPVKAVNQAKVDIAILVEKYADPQAKAISIIDFQVDVRLFKWASKAACYFITGEEIVCNELIPCVNYLLAYTDAAESSLLQD